MSGGKKEHWQNTKEQIRKPNPIKDGKTWLGHGEYKQAGVIDQLLLEGKYTLEELARELTTRGLFRPELPWQARIARIRNHFVHLQEGDGRAMSPHRLKLKQVGGKWMFDVD